MTLMVSLNYINTFYFIVKREDALCHIAFFVGILVVYFLSVFFSSGSNTSSPKPSIMSDIRNDIEKNAFDSTVNASLPENPVIDTSYGDTMGLGCSLYIADSSIPHSGFGIFSMKAVKEGEIIIPQSKSIEVHNDIRFSSYMMIIKQHGTYANVNGGVDGAAIVATKDIEAGEELFFKFDDYSHDVKAAYDVLHPHDPTSMLFAKVDDITQKLIDTIPVQKIEVRPTRKQYKQKAKNKKYIMKPSLDATALIKLMKDTLKDYDSNLANLLPSTHSEAKSLINAGGSELFISYRRSSDWLSKHGICVDGVHPMNSDGSKGAIATRSISKGDLVITSPLLAIKNDSDIQNCFCTNSNEGLKFCPLSFISYLNTGLPQSECNVENRNDCPQNMSNAYYHLSKYNKENENLKNLSIDDAIKVSNYE